MKNRAKTIASIIKKHPEPDMNRVPKIILKWSTKKDGLIYHDLITGKRLEGNEVDTRIRNWDNPLRPELLCCSGTTLKGYVEFYEKERVVELSSIIIKLNRRKEGEVGKWEFAGERLFVFIDEYPHNIYDESGMPQNRDKIHERLQQTQRGQASIFYSKVTGRETTGKWWTDLQGLERFLKAQKAPHTEEELTDKEKLIREGNKLLEEYPTIHRVGISEAIVRNFPTMSILDAYSSWGKMCRFYYNGKIWATSTNLNWDKAMSISSMENVAITNPEDLKNGFFKYQANLFGKPSSFRNEPGLFGWTGRSEDSTKISSSKLLTPMIKEPAIEQLLKAYGAFMCDNISNMSDFKYFYGAINSKGKTLTEKLKVNKYQLELISRLRKERVNAQYDRPIAYLKIFFGNSTRSLDNETTKWFINNLTDFKILGDRLENEWRFAADEHNFIRAMVSRIRVSENRNVLVAILSDTIRTWENLDYPRPELSPCSANELPRLHDIFVQLSRTQLAERLRETALEQAKQDKRNKKIYAKRIETRQGFEYEDDEYVIRLPKDQSEIVREGMELHHCVGGYANSHEKGESTILFLRKKSDIDKPFYTIEVNIAVHEDGSTSSHIVQIHGFGNGWIGNNPEAIPTIIKWLRKNNIQCNDKILTSTSKSYPMGNNFIKMPKVA